MYRHTNFSHLVNRSNIYEESKNFSLAMKKVVEVNDWSRITANIAFSSLKKLLIKTNISKNFISTITLPYDKKLNKTLLHFVFQQNIKNYQTMTLKKW